MFALEKISERKIVLLCKNKKKCKINTFLEILVF